MRYLLIILFVLSSCAHVVAPQGGPEDKAGPILETTYPKDQSVRISQKTPIRFEFNEWISPQLNVQDLQISPPLAVNPKLSVNANVLEIELRSALDSATTYSINFGKSLKDLRNNSLNSNARLTFSTGDKLDSLKIKGVVRSGFSGASATLALYSQESFEKGFQEFLMAQKDSTKKAKWPKASYLTQTDSLGRFDFQYIRPEKWMVVAFSDLNSNNIPDYKTEVFALQKNVKSDSNLYLSMALSENKNVDSTLSLDTLVKDTLIEAKIESVYPASGFKVGLSDSVLVKFNQKYDFKTWEKRFKIVVQNDTLNPQVIEVDSLTVWLRLLKPLKYNQKLEILQVNVDTAQKSSYLNLSRYSTWEELQVSAIRGQIIKGNERTQVILKSVQTPYLTITATCNPSGEFITPPMLTGEYSIWWYEDLNKNNKWDEAEFETFKEAEPSYFSPKFTLKKGDMNRIQFDAFRKGE